MGTAAAGALAGDCTGVAVRLLALVRPEVVAKGADGGVASAAAAACRRVGADDDTTPAPASSASSAPKLLTAAGVTIARLPL